MTAKHDKVMIKHGAFHPTKKNSRRQFIFFQNIIDIQRIYFLFFTLIFLGLNDSIRVASVNGFASNSFKNIIQIVPSRASDFKGNVRRPIFSTNDGHIILSPFSATKCTSLFAVQKMLNTADEPKSLVNDFKPATMTLVQSMIFFVKYLIKHQKEQLIKKQLLDTAVTKSKLWPSKLSKEDIGKSDLERLKAEVKKEQMEKRPLLETLRNLNDSRKELIELVGYDANLLVSCFGFAVLAAFMNSVIPHYYGQSVNCLANAMTTTRPDIVKALTGLGVASVLCALFTGIRGALFWLAGASYVVLHAVIVSIIC
jgi:hypothetical protein